MINIDPVQESYFCCQSCLSKENLFKITIGLEKKQTSSVRLCKKCLNELNFKATSMSEIKRCCANCFNLFSGDGNECFGMSNPENNYCANFKDGPETVPKNKE